MNRNEAYRRLGDVREEYRAAIFSLSETLRACNSNPATHHAGHRQHVSLGNLQSCFRNLQITYVVRLFAEFEAILRDYWLNARKRTTRPPMMDLINSLAAYRTMPADDVQYAHEVREYRNDVIHSHLQDPRFDFSVCSSRLAKFLSWFPQTW
jgi:hypothetical protein